MVTWLVPEGAKSVLNRSRKNKDVFFGRKTEFRLCNQLSAHVSAYSRRVLRAAALNFLARSQFIENVDQARMRQ